MVRGSTPLRRKVDSSVGRAIVKLWVRLPLRKKTDSQIGIDNALKMQLKEEVQHFYKNADQK
jgi:hypothetical protein